MKGIVILFLAATSSVVGSPSKSSEFISADQMNEWCLAKDQSKITEFVLGAVEMHNLLSSVQSADYRFCVPPNVTVSQLVGAFCSKMSNAKPARFGEDAVGMITGIFGLSLAFPYTSSNAYPCWRENSN